MRNTFYILLGIFILSCSQKQKQSEKIKCAVISSERIPIVSIMDEINRKPKWRVKTECYENTFIVGKEPLIGDSIEIEIITYK